MPALFRKRSTVVLLLILFAVIVLFAVKSYTGALQQNRTRAVAAEFGLAMKELQQSPPGIQRVDLFLTRLKAVDTRDAAPEVEQALRGYIAALEPSLQAARTGRDIGPYDKAIVQAKQRLTDAVRDNE
jgi:predicted negative regulator of RcsB-dependent stress response